MRLNERFAALAQFPLLGRKRDEVRTGYRSITEGDYLILYRLVNDAELEIMRVV
jgi:plasmid stabilization system protein ParE